jgi:hypothetical protein
MELKKIICPTRVHGDFPIVTYDKVYATNTEEKIEIV